MSNVKWPTPVKWMSAISATIAVIVIAATSYFSPWMTLSSLKGALAKKDRAEIESLVDFAAVSANMKGQMIADMANRTGLSASNEEFMKAAGEIEAIVEKLATPDNLMKLLNSGLSLDEKGVEARCKYANVGAFYCVMKRESNGAELAVRLRRLGPFSWKMDWLAASGTQKAADEQNTRNPQ